MKRQQSIKELDKFLTVKVLEDTPVVLSLRKLCEDHGYSYEWAVVKNHVSSKKVRGYNAIRKTTSQSSSQGYRRLLLRQARLVEHLQHQYRRKVLGQNLFQHQLDVRVQMTKDDRQIPKPKFYLDYDQERRDPYFPKYPNGCKNSERILWMKESLNTDSHASSSRGSSLTELGRSDKGLKFQGLLAEDALVKSYFVQKCLVT